MYIRRSIERLDEPGTVPLKIFAPMKLWSEYPLRILLCLVAVLFLSACSVGDDSDAVGGDGSTRPPPPVPDPVLSAVEYGIKSFTLRWAPVIGADTYRLYEDADVDGGLGFVQIGLDMDASTLSYTHEVFLPERRYAAYMLESCEDRECTPSPARFVGYGEGEIVLSGAIGYFKATNTEANDRFGATVAISADGSTLAVAAPDERGGKPVVCAPDEDDCQEAQDDNSLDQAGAVYVYARTAQGWVPRAYIKAPNAGRRDRFGSSLSLSADGNVLAVGAPFEESDFAGVCAPAEEACREAMASNAHVSNTLTGGGAGAVYVFERSGQSWSASSYIKSSIPSANAAFGDAIALSRDGDTLLIGGPRTEAPPTEDGPGPARGAVHIYARNDGGWIERQIVYPPVMPDPPGPPQLELFGRSLALSGDGRRFVVGAQRRELRVNSNNSQESVTQGWAFLYERNDGDGGGWGRRDFFVGDNVDANEFSNDRFGEALALSETGDVVAIGASADGSDATGVSDDKRGNPTGARNSGAVHLYALSEEGTSWVRSAYVKASIIPDTVVTSNTGFQFGAAVALSSDGAALVVGAPNEGRKMSGVDGLLPSSEFDDVDTIAGSGAAFYLQRQPAGWLQLHIKAPNPQISAAFGSALALSADGQTLVVGAPREDSAAKGIGGDQFNTDVEAVPAAGAAYLY